MFDPHTFETELRDQPVTVEIGRCYPAHTGSDVEPPQDEECEFEVYGDSGKLDLYWDESVTIHGLVIEHLKFCKMEVEL